jgi:protein involved in polysaccharide export with SLBB domain
MSPSAGQIGVKIHGAVRAQGSYILSRPATIRDGLAAAGGLAEATLWMSPSGMVTVRRHVPSGQVEVYRFSTSKASTLWEQFELQDRDFVVFAWRVDAISGAT